MVKTGHAPLRRVAWQPSHPGRDIEVLRLRDLAPNVPAGRVERLEFHVVALYTRGLSRHEVDFAAHRTSPGTLVHVRPGQVHRFHLHGGVDGLALIFTPSFLFPRRAERGSLWHERFFEDVAWPTVLRLDPARRRLFTADLERVRHVCEEHDGRPITTALVQHLVAAALLDLARATDLDGSSREGAGAHPRTRAFVDAVERSYRVTRRVLDYAEALGCSSRSLDRSVRDAFGTSAKEYVDERVVLEAKRLLVHTTRSVTEIADELGFSESTNFVKFFKARVGRGPGAFRRLDVARS